MPRPQPVRQAGPTQVTAGSRNPAPFASQGGPGGHPQVTVRAGNAASSQGAVEAGTRAAPGSNPSGIGVSVQSGHRAASSQGMSASVQQGRATRGGVQVELKGSVVSEPRNPLFVSQPQANVVVAPPKIASLTVILSTFERPQMLRRQVQYLAAQTMGAEVLAVVANAGTVPHDHQMLSPTSGLVSIVHNMNLGPWARFIDARKFPTKYLAILDDDVLPGPKWIEACIERLEEAEKSGEGTYCISPTGEIFQSDSSQDSYRVGPLSPRPEEMEVDVGKQGWVFRRDLLDLFDAFPRNPDQRVGWDLHFAAACQSKGILTIVLPYEIGNKAAWGAIEPPSTERSLSQQIDEQGAQGGKNYAYVRDEAYRFYRAQGWTPQCVPIEDEAPEPEPGAA